MARHLIVATPEVHTEQPDRPTQTEVSTGPAVDTARYTALVFARNRRSTAVALGAAAVVAGLAYAGGRFYCGPDVSLMALMIALLAVPLFVLQPVWSPAATAAAAAVGWQLAGGDSPDGLAVLAFALAVGLTSVATAMRAARERLVGAEIADLTQTNQQLTAANAAQAEASEVAEALFAATRDISTSLEATEVAARVARNAWSATQSIGAAVLLWDADSEVFRIAAVAGAGGGNAEMRQLEVPLRTAAALQSALDEGMADIARSALRDPVLDALLRRWRAAAILAARLQRGDRLLGLVITARRTASPAPAKACRLLSGIALQAAAALESANLVNDLRTASSLREEFTATMSHELRTPLNVIIGYTEMQREGMFGELSEDHLATLARVHEQSLQLLELIQTTLDVGRLERGLMTVDVREVCVQDVLTQLFAAIPPVWRKPSVELNWRVDANVPRIRSDAAKLQVIVRNLVHNALKFTDSGQVTVTVTADSNQERVHIVVQDSGRGIAAQDLNVIFEMFRQSSERDPAAGGVGLGLYIVKRLVALLGGEIDVRSAPARGATFRVHLPMAGPHATAARGNPRTAGALL